MTCMSRTDPIKVRETCSPTQMNCMCSYKYLNISWSLTLKFIPYVFFLIVKLIYLTKKYLLEEYYLVTDLLVTLKDKTDAQNAGSTFSIIRAPDY